MSIQPIPSASVQAAINKVRSLPRQLRFAAAGAINDVLFEARQAEQRAMRDVFDRPTPYIVNSVLVRTATADKLAGELYVDFWGRGKGVAPEKVLAAQVFGGRRRAKRAEVALQRAGLLPQGFGMVPAAAAPLDAYGNVRGPYIVQLLAYFKAFSEVGYRANMTDKRRKALAKRGKSARGFSAINGVEYFVSRGQAETTGRGAWRKGHMQHLPRGIWQRSGIHGSTIKPVFLFVRLPTYWRRLDFDHIAAQVVQGAFPARLAARLQRALATAR